MTKTHYIWFSGRGFAFTDIEYNLFMMRGWWEKRCKEWKRGMRDHRYYEWCDHPCWKTIRDSW